MKKRILSVFLTVVMVAGLMTGGVHAAGPVLTEALLAGAESLTQSGERTLDAASGTPVVPSGLDFKSDFYSAYAYSVQLAEDTRLYISFTNIVDETDTFIDIYKDSDTGIIRVTDCDYPTNCGEGYSEVFNAGKYYIVCGFRDSVGSALFSISFEGMSMGEMISRPIEASSLPLNIEAELSPASEGAVCINGKTTPEYPWAVTTNVCVARTYRLDMKAGETIFVSSNAGNGDNTNFSVHIFRDPDSGSDYKLPDVTGECYFSAPTDGSYYLVISSDSVSYTKTVKVSVTAAQTTTINDLIAGASPISKLPYTERMQLDSGAASVTSERCGYFRAYSIDLEAGTAVNLQLAATSGERDVELNVFTGNLKDGYSLIKSYDNDNYSGKGEQEMLFSEDGGTYYILCSTVDYASAGEVSFTVTASELRTLKEEMERVVPVSLPIFEEVVFDGVSNAIYNESDRTICFGKLYAVSMETDETIRISFGSPGMKSSTFVYVFRADSNGDPQFIQKFDRNEYGASSLGETVLFSADTEGIYYILAAGENGCVDDRVNSLIIDYVELMPSLILSGDNAGAQDSDDLWSWDGSTLTLKDGFELYTQDRSILFNSDIKIVVEGDALIYSNDSFALYGFSGEGRVDLELKSGAKLICHSDLEGCIYCGDIDIYASEGAAETPEVYLDSMSEHITDQFAVIDCMGISVEDVSMRIVSNDSAVMAYGGDISFINSDITIDSDGSGIVEFGLLDVIGSRLSIVSNLDSICGFIYGPYSYDDYTKIGTLDAELPGQLDPLPGLGAVGKAFEDINSVRFYDSEVTLISTWDDCIDIPGELTIIDSSVIGRSWYDTIYAETGINISGSGLKLSCGDSESSVIGGQADTEVDIDGKFRCYNRFGVLNYTGELTDSMRKPSAGYYELFTEYGGESTLVRKIDTVYDYLAGKNAEWSPGASDAGVFRVDAPLSRFVDVCLDGMPLGKGDYELRSGSTIVTLNPPVYSALSFGRHTLRINYSDGWAETEFTVLGGNPGTGDGIVIAALCAVLAVTVLGSVVIIRRKSVR